MAKTYMVQSGAQNTAAAPTKLGLVAATLKTLIQIATPTTEDVKIVEWGISFDGTTAGVPVQVELIDVNVAATVTAFAAADVIKWNQPNDPGTLVTLGTTAGGYNASAEGTITSAREIASLLIPPNQPFVMQYPLGREPVVPISRFLRLRCNAPAAVNATAYIIWEE